MDQTIGIGYQVDGVSQVIKANNDVIGSFEKVVSKVGQMSGTLSGFATHISGLNKSMAGLSSLGAGSTFAQTFKGSSVSINASARSIDKLNTALANTPDRVWAAGAAIKRLTSIVQNYAAAVNSVKPLPTAIPKVGQVGGVDTGTGGGKGTGSSIHNRDILSMTPRFMFAWRAGSEAIRGVHYGVTDVLLARSREKLGTELGQLSPLGFDQELKSKTEMSAKMFSQKFWTVSAESYVTAMAQTASAFDVSLVGYKNLQRMNEASLQFSMVAKMSQEKAADLVQKTLLSIITGLPAEVAKKLNAGELADVRGYGKVDLGGLAEGVSTQLSKTIAVSAIWGPGIQSAFRGALPTLVDKGWDLPSALALIGAYVDIGFQPGTSGKGAKDIFEKEPANLAMA
jgi:hypothetical protein